MKIRTSPTNRVMELESKGRNESRSKEMEKERMNDQTNEQRKETLKYYRSVSIIP